MYVRIQQATFSRGYGDNDTRVLLPREEEGLAATLVGGHRVSS